MASADFFEHGERYRFRPTFRASPTRGYASKISPDKGRELSLPKLLIYLRPLFRFAFAVSSPLVWDRRPRIRFLFVAWQVLAGCCRLRHRASIAGFLLTVGHPSAVALASYSLLLEFHLVECLHKSYRNKVQGTSTP